MEKHAPLVFLKQGDVARESSALLAPGSMGPTASAAVLLFLLTGQDANNLLQDEDPKISEAKKKALISYIQDKLREASNRQDEINEILISSNIVVPRPVLNKCVKRLLSCKKK